jgi:hypothetical protein
VLLITGGETDPNVGSLLARARERGIEARALLVGPGTHPSIDWDVDADRLRLDGDEVRPSALFHRYDVFAQLADQRKETGFRASAWYTALHGWALAHPEVRMLNRRYAGQTNKPFMLDLARRCGLRIPHTRITNDLDALEREAASVGPSVAKPLTGGGFAQPLETLLSSTTRRDGRSAAPAFVQQRLVPPEVRIYGVGCGAGRRHLAFRVESTALDYRSDDGTKVIDLRQDEIDDDAVAGLGRLMDALEMDYAAADFKTCPDTGRLAFLEINSAPMFVAFDQASGSAVSDAILDFLT